jgi:hypothetical protein
MRGGGELTASDAPSSTVGATMLPSACALWSWDRAGGVEVALAGRPDLADRPFNVITPSSGPAFALAGAPLIVDALRCRAVAATFDRDD